jgi:hypothetical protein
MHVARESAVWPQATTRRLAASRLAKCQSVGTRLESLAELPACPVATDAEARFLIEREQLYGLGVGYIDVHLIASARLRGNTTEWMGTLR